MKNGFLRLNRHEAGLRGLFLVNSNGVSQWASLSAKRPSPSDIHTPWYIVYTQERQSVFVCPWCPALSGWANTSLTDVLRGQLGPCNSSNRLCWDAGWVIWSQTVTNGSEGFCVLLSHSLRVSVIAFQRFRSCSNLLGGFLIMNSDELLWVTVRICVLS